MDELNRDDAPTVSCGACFHHRHLSACYLTALLEIRSVHGGSLGSLSLRCDSEGDAKNLPYLHSRQESDDVVMVVTHLITAQCRDGQYEMSCQMLIGLIGAIQNSNSIEKFVSCNL